MEILIIALLVVGGIILFGKFLEKWGHFWESEDGEKLSNGIFSVIFGGAALGLVVLGLNLPMAVGWIPAAIGIFMFKFLWETRKFR